MTLEQDRIKSLNFDTPEIIPVSVGILPAAWMKYRGELDRLVARYPDVLGSHARADRDYDAVEELYVQGEHVDAWGCVWSNLKTGMASMVTGHPVPTRESVRTLRPPREDIGLPHGFMYLRLADLRGFEELMIDCAEEPPELQLLIDTVLEYNLRQVPAILATLTEPGQIVYIGDDLGMQHALPISPGKWRRYLKPCFAAIFRPFREAGHYVYLHSDGHIAEIIPDLAECGANVINPQIRANGLDSLVAQCKGRVCVDLDLDRQMFPFCTPAEIDAHVRESVERLALPEGGLWLKAEIGDDVPLANIEAICDALDRYRGYFRGAEVPA